MQLVVIARQQYWEKIQHFLVSISTVAVSDDDLAKADLASRILNICSMSLLQVTISEHCKINSCVDWHCFTQIGAVETSFHQSSSNVMQWDLPATYRAASSASAQYSA